MHGRLNPRAFVRDAPQLPEVCKFDCNREMDTPSRNFTMSFFRLSLLGRSTWRRQASFDFINVLVQNAPSCNCGCEGAAQPFVVMERRLSFDGYAHTLEEFVDHFGLEDAQALWADSGAVQPAAYP